jgi:hypothetical protein
MLSARLLVCAIKGRGMFSLHQTSSSTSTMLMATQGRKQASFRFNLTIRRYKTKHHTTPRRTPQQEHCLPRSNLAERERGRASCRRWPP